MLPSTVRGAVERTMAAARLLPLTQRLPVALVLVEREELQHFDFRESKPRASIWLRPP